MVPVAMSGRRFFLVVFALALAARAAILLFSPDVPVSDEERHQGVLALHTSDGLVMPLGAYRYEEYAGGTVATGLAAGLSFRLLGPTLLALRLPSLLLAALGIALFALCFRRVLGILPGTLAAAVLILAPPYPARMGVTAFGNHAELAGLLGLWLLLFVRVAFGVPKMKRVGPWHFAFGLVTGFCVFFDHLALLFLPVAAVFWWAGTAGSSRAPAGASFLGGAFLGFLPWFFTSGTSDFAGRLFRLFTLPPGEAPIRGLSAANLKIFLSGTILESAGWRGWVGPAAFLVLASAGAAVLILEGKHLRSLFQGASSRRSPEGSYFGLFAVFTVVFYLAALFALRVDSPPRYLLPLFPFLITLPVFLVRTARVFLIVPAALALFSGVQVGEDLTTRVRPELTERGYAFRYFLPTFADYYGVGFRIQKIMGMMAGADARDAEALYEGFIVGHAALVGRDVTRHIARLSGAKGRLPDFVAEGIARAVIARDRRNLEMIVEGETVEGLKGVTGSALIQGVQAMRLRGEEKEKPPNVTGDDIETLKAYLSGKKGVFKIARFDMDPVPGARIHRLRRFDQKRTQFDIPDVKADYLAGWEGAQWDLIRCCGRRVFDVRALGMGAALVARNLLSGDPGGLVAPRPVGMDTVPVVGGKVRVTGKTFQVASFRIDRTETSIHDYTAFLCAAKLTPEELDRFIDLTGTGQKIVKTDEGFRLFDGCQDFPVVYVTYYGARAYCRWRGGDLPTTAEWVRAARGDDGRTYPWGDEPPGPTRANIWGDGDGHPGCAPVDAYPAGASAYGALQMAGNVYEWPRSGDLRGGYWLGREEELRIDYAEANAPDTANEHDGFRCVYP